MARTGLTAREAAAWEQLAAQLSDADAATPPARTPDTGRHRARLAVAAALLPTALLLLVAGSATGSGALAWGGVTAWIGAVLTVSHVLGHGPRLPWRP
ncbi:hypothetical protein SUDANB120_00212 [Streptomyces sp. enrichment culture]|uniref:hypothetical protein n=1 Tax=Streptomyces TaxID=1883 RepID=UPI0016728940|nr:MULTISPECIES: hypothetical protein [Streptomyces]MBD3578015.1 hypothetical protein [Streptomyces sp. KD18]GGT02587.1 hypothetical protein GCM10010286_29720 [Streptomyces toxytricini]